MAKVVGIDLGTTNSVVAVMEGTSPTVIPNAGRRAHDPVGRGLTKTGRGVSSANLQNVKRSPSRSHHLLDPRHMGESGYVVKVDRARITRRRDLGDGSSKSSSTTRVTISANA